MPFQGDLLAHYNGIDFDDARTETIQFQMVPKYDRAGRTVVHVVYTIGLRTIITSDQLGVTTDELMDAMQDALCVPGKQFIFADAGCGNLSVNVGSVKDVVWGPKPQMLTYKPIGSGAAIVEWFVELCIPRCDDPAYQNAIMEFNYELTYITDRNGYNTRVYRGYLTIPQTRNGDNRRIIDTADKYFDSVNPRLPKNYRLGPRQHTLDSSKCRCDFEIIHESMGNNIPPPGVVDVKASHHIHSTDKGLYGWIGTIRAEYECAQDFEPQKCWKHFFELVRERLREARVNQAGPNPNGGGGFLANAGNFLLAVGGGALVGGARGGWVGAAIGGGVGAVGFVLGNKGDEPKPESMPIPIYFSFGEPSIYGKPQVAEFELQYWFNRPINELLLASGVWKPVKGLIRGDEWSDWQASLQMSALNLRGNDDARFNPADDIIIDLCLSRRKVQLQTQPEERQQPRLQTIPEAELGPCPDPSDSWLFYENKIEVKTDDKVIEHKPLPKPSGSSGQTFTSPSASQYPEAERFWPKSSTGTSGFNYSSDVGSPASTIHRRTEDSIEVFIVGKALRACYDIEPPKLIKFGDNFAVPANRPEQGEGYEAWVIGNYGRPVVAARWRLRYIIPTRPRQRVSLGTTPSPMSTREQPRLSTFE